MTGTLRKILCSAVLCAVAALCTGCGRSAADGESKTIRILTTTDTHGRFLPYDYALNRPDTSGSLAQVATKVAELRRENPNTILVDAGDVIEDNAEALFIDTEINPMMLAMNRMGYDVFTLGNHEFNYGMDALKHVTGQFEGAILCGNVYDSATGARIAAPYTVLEKDGIKIGFIGMVTPNITRWDAANLKDFTVTNPVDETKAAIEELQAQGVNAIVAVMHLSVPQEYGEPGSGALDVLEACPEIDAFVAAHLHLSIPRAYCYAGKAYVLNEADGTVSVTAKDGSVTPGTVAEYDTAKAQGTVLIEAYKWAQALGQLDLTFTKNAAGRHEIADKARDITTALYPLAAPDGTPVAVDAALAEELQPFSDAAIADADTPIGELRGALVPENEIPGIEEVRLRPTALITLIQDTQRYYGELLCGHAIDVSSAADFRYGPNLAQGEIKKCDTARIYMYDNSLYVLKITGAQLKKYMEWSYEYYNTYHPGDLSISFNPTRPGYDFDMFAGVNYEVNVAKEPGARIEHLTKADGTAVREDEVLYLAVNNYRANTSLLTYGTIYKEGEPLPDLVVKSDEAAGFGDVRIRDLLGRYLQEVKGGVLVPECDENWRITGNDWDPAGRAKAVACAKKGLLASVLNAGQPPFENTQPITGEMVKNQ